jgi:fibro-slime domain-containing protein
MTIARFRPAACGALAVIGMTNVTVAQSVPEPPDEIVISGTVRDFRKSHVDFNVEPPDGTGHYAGNVDMSLRVDRRPVFTGKGFKVAKQWRNTRREPIAPHSFRDSGGDATVRVADKPTLDDNAVVDTWDSSLGPYGGDNVGPPPDLEIGVPMPDVAEPPGMGPSVGDLDVDDATFTGTLHCDNLTINGTVKISGNVTILCEGDFTMATHSDLELGNGATLSLYVKGNVTFQPHTDLNVNSGQPKLVFIFVLGAEEIRLSQPLGRVYANVIAPKARMRVMPNAEFFGTYIGSSLDVQAVGGFHVDTNSSIPLDVCGNVVNDTAGAPAMNSPGAVTSTDTFDQWYREVLGVSLSAAHEITLVRNAYDIYEFKSDAFYPVDGMLFGNEGDAHNQYFTYAISCDFVYDACADQFVEFGGSDDCWMFVDDSLAMDLGGLVPGTEQVVELDRLGLEHGKLYELCFFFAHRYDGPPAFNLRTNVELWTEALADAASFPCD